MLVDRRWKLSEGTNTAYGLAGAVDSTRIRGNVRYIGSWIREANICPLYSSVAILKISNKDR